MRMLALLLFLALNVLHGIALVRLLEGVGHSLDTMSENDKFFETLFLKKFDLLSVTIWGVRHARFCFPVRVLKLRNQLLRLFASIISKLVLWFPLQHSGMG